MTLVRRAFAFTFVLSLVAAPARAVVVCPGPNSVWGIDVSSWQGNIDWNKVKGAGKDFAIIRVSDGLGYKDQYFAQNWAGAKNAGVIRGAYQFFEPAQDPVAQANLLLQMMGPLQPGDLPPMIDVEADNGLSPAQITASVHKWIDTVEKATGRKPLIYTGAWFWNPKVATGDFASYPLVDSYYCNNCCPNIAAPWTSWAMWQYSSTGSVAGISGNVDLDRFDGTMADLMKLTGGVDYAAKYVSQSWPLASSALQMTVNQDIKAQIVLKNAGEKSWNANTRLGTTQPRDRASVFAGADWIDNHRAAACKAGAAPGANCAFDFTWHAPNKPGDYHEFFTLVQEGVAWFSDKNQGGPPDNQIEAWIHVSEADYHGEFVRQSYPLAPAAQNAHEGDLIDGWIELKNVGNQTWKAGVTKLAPTPRDKASNLQAPGWLSATRVSTVMADTAPGAVGRFPLPLKAPAAGDYNQTFGLVHDGVTWFADAPKGGGPEDSLLKVHLNVTPAMMVMVDMGSAPDMAKQPKVDAGGGGGGMIAPDGGVDEGDAGNSGLMVMGGCEVGAGRDSGGAVVLVVLLVGMLVRRRRQE